MSLTTNSEAIYTGSRTIGGLPADQAEHWCEKNYQVLGNLVYQMTLGKLPDRLKAQSQVFEMRRHFMRDEWDQYINALEELRNQEYIGRESRESIVSVCKQVSSKPVYKAEIVEQLSLF